MKIAIIFGLGKSRTSDGNGLRKLGEWYASNGHTVEYFSCGDSINKSFDRFVVHSLGFRTYLKADQPQADLIAIEPVPNYFRWLNIFGGKGEPILAPSIGFITSYYTNSWPKSVLVTGQSCINIFMPGTSHISIISAVVERLMAIR